MNKKLIDQYLIDDKEMLHEQTMFIMQQLHPEVFDSIDKYENPEEFNKKLQELIDDYNKPDDIFKEINVPKEAAEIEKKEEMIFDESSLINPLILKHYLAKSSAISSVVSDTDISEKEKDQLSLNDELEEKTLELNDDYDNEDDILKLDNFNEEELLEFNKDEDNDLFILELNKLLAISESILSESGSIQLSKLPDYMYSKDKLPIKLGGFIKINNRPYYPVFIILTRSNTLFQKIINPLAGLEYGHVSISTDPKLHRMFSFSGNSEKKDGGFTVESLVDGAMKELAFGGSKYAIYGTLLSKEKIMKVIRYINNVMASAERYKYQFKQLLRIPFNMVNTDKHAMICSEFVANALQEADRSLVGGLHTSLTTPGNVVTEKFFFISSGLLKDYDYRYTIKKVKEMARTKQVVRYLVENYTGAANYEVFKKMYRTMPNFSNLFRKFYPTTIIKPAVLFRCTNGGVYSTSLLYEGKIDTETLMSLYDENKNAYKVKITDPDHVSYCFILHNLVKLVFLSDNLDHLSDKKVSEKIEKYILFQWEDRVINAYDKLKAIKDKASPEIKKWKQVLLDLMWDYRDNPHDYVRRNSNRYLFAQMLGNIAFPVEEGFISKEEYKINFKKIYDYDQSFFLTSEPTYPVFNATDLEMYVDVYCEVESFERMDFVQNWLNKYIELGCNFKIPADSEMAKVIPKEYKFIVDDEFVFDSLNE